MLTDQYANIKWMLNIENECYTYRLKKILRFSAKAGGFVGYRGKICDILWDDSPILIRTGHAVGADGRWECEDARCGAGTCKDAAAP
jgi:hypothetical protein